MRRVRRLARFALAVSLWASPLVSAAEIDGGASFSLGVGYDTNPLRVTLDGPDGPNGKLAILASLRRVDYGHATVPGTTSGELLGSVTQRVIARYDWQTARALGLYAEAGLQNSDNQDPLFTYGRNWVTTGIQYRRHSARD